MDRALMWIVAILAVIGGGTVFVFVINMIFNFAEWVQRGKEREGK